jgi:pimeloyl-ACP methyl ester carboxylesterase
VSAPEGSELVQVERLTVPGLMPPANPSVHNPGDSGPYETPPELAQVPYLRYHYRESQRPVEAIVLCMPGFAGGAGSFDYFARHLVTFGAGRLEVWALDRRSNLLEDHFGADMAENAGDFQVGIDYYYEGVALAGQTFPGFLSDGDLPFLSEWGLYLTLTDLQAVVQKIPLEQRNQVLFLAGHSLGGTIVQLYAAMDFDKEPSTLGDAGFQQLAGLILLDGGNDPGSADTQEDYERQVEKIRLHGRYTSFPGLTPTVHALLELFGIMAVHEPTAEAPMEQLLSLPGVDSPIIRSLFGSARYTHRAALGVTLDDNFQPLYVEQASVGFLTGGPVNSNERNGKTSYNAADTSGQVLYGWDTYKAAELPVPDPQREEVTDIDDLAYSLYLGPANFSEWYFPARLSADLGPVGDFQVNGADDWRAKLYDLWIVHNRQVDIPVIGFFGGENDALETSKLAGYQASIAPYLRDGSARGAANFEMQTCGGYEHLDVLLADAGNSNRPNLILTRLKTWLAEKGLLGSGRGIDPQQLK